MTDAADELEILFVDDDPQVLDQLRQLMPAGVGGHPVAWNWCNDFDEALRLLRRRRFDMLVSDIYRGRDAQQKNIATGDVRAKNLIDEVRQRRFCPIVLFTDGQVPPGLIERPFVWCADKADPKFSDQLEARIGDALRTGLPAIARRLHDELDRFAGSYVWQFLAGQWDLLREKHGLDETALERVIRRRAAIQLGRIDGLSEDPVERGTADAVDYYIYPPIAPSLRLGEIVRRKGINEFRIVLTPHCFLVTQPSHPAPRATHVLAARTIPAAEFGSAWKWQTEGKQFEDDLRRRTALPASKVVRVDPPPPEGRYCFLPGFLEIPDLYCDLFQVESIGYESLVTDFDRIAVLDTPYAEALQACMARLYGHVGVPVLNLDNVKHLGP